MRTHRRSLLETPWIEDSVVRKRDSAALKQIEPPWHQFDASVPELQDTQSAREDHVEPSQILSGWKDIATYLGKGVRTVQRYERDLALPIRRPAGQPHGSVLAIREELYAWAIAERTMRTYVVPAHSPLDFTNFKKNVEQTQSLCIAAESMKREFRLTLANLRAATARLKRTMANSTLK